MSTETLERPLGATPFDSVVDYEQQVADRVVLHDPVAYAESYLATAKLQRRTDVTEETIEAALGNAEVLLPTARIAIRMPTERFQEMVSSDGVYKTVYETSTTKGLDAAPLKTVENYVNMRRQTEEQLGNSARPGEPETVYGYLDNLESMEMVTPALQYGTVGLILKSKVANRTTFTHGDTMRGPTTPMDLPTAVVAKEINDIAEVSGNHKVSYIEAQIFGGVSMEDLETISLTLDVNHARQTIEDIDNFVASVRESHPELPLIIRIPAGTKILIYSVDLAAKYPDIQFVYFVDIEDVDGMFTDTPFRTRMKQRHQRSEADVSEEFRQRMIEEADATYQAAQDRVTFVRQKLLKRWNETTGQEVLPENVKVMFTRSRFRKIG